MGARSRGLLGLLASWLCLVVLSAVAHLMTLDADFMLTSAAYASPTYRSAGWLKQKAIAHTELFPGLGFLDRFDGKNLAWKRLDAVQRVSDVRFLGHLIKSFRCGRVQCARFSSSG